jgi:hypothetical protein
LCGKQEEDPVYLLIGKKTLGKTELTKSFQSAGAILGTLLIATTVSKIANNLSNTASSSSYSNYSSSSSNSSYSPESSSSSTTTNRSSGSDICNDIENAQIPIYTPSEWKNCTSENEYLKGPYDCKEIIFSDGIKATLSRWNKTNEAAKEYHVPFYYGRYNIKYHYKTEASAIKAIYIYEKCGKNRKTDLFTP